MKRNLLLFFVCVLVAVSGCGDKAPVENPFFAEWTTPFGAPPFDQIQEEHFLPAFERAIADERQEVEAIAQNPEPPTFENTLVALDATGELMNKVSGVFYTLTGAETNDQIQAIAKEVAPMRSNLRDDIMMNPQLFERLKAIYEQRDELDLDEEQLWLLKKTYLDFVNGGAELDDVDKQRMREINTRLSTLRLQFSDNVLALFCRRDISEMQTDEAVRARADERMRRYEETGDRSQWDWLTVFGPLPADYVPPFDYEDAGTGIGSALGPLAVLSLITIVLVAIGLAAFIRYDVR